MKLIFTVLFFVNLASIVIALPFNLRNERIDAQNKHTNSVENADAPKELKILKFQKGSASFGSTTHNYISLNPKEPSTGSDPKYNLPSNKPKVIPVIKEKVGASYRPSPASVEQGPQVESVKENADEKLVYPKKIDSASKGKNYAQKQQVVYPEAEYEQQQQVVVPGNVGFPASDGSIPPEQPYNPIQHEPSATIEQQAPVEQVASQDQSIQPLAEEQPVPVEQPTSQEQIIQPLAESPMPVEQSTSQEQPIQPLAESQVPVEQSEVVDEQSSPEEQSASAEQPAISSEPHKVTKNNPEKNESQEEPKEQESVGSVVNEGEIQDDGKQGEPMKEETADSKSKNDYTTLTPPEDEDTKQDEDSSKQPEQETNKQSDGGETSPENATKPEFDLNKENKPVTATTPSSDDQSLTSDNTSPSVEPPKPSEQSENASSSTEESTSDSSEQSDNNSPSYEQSATESSEQSTPSEPSTSAPSETPVEPSPVEISDITPPVTPSIGVSTEVQPTQPTPLPIGINNVPPPTFTPQTSTVVVQITPETCPDEIESLGCFRNSGIAPMPLPEIIANRQKDQTLEDFLCECANTALAKKYYTFGLSSNKCYSGPDEGRYDEDGHSDKCYNDDKKTCTDNDAYCQGTEESMFVYSVITPDHAEVVRLKDE